MKFDGILFDLDGTLWDSCRSVAGKAGATRCARYGARHLPGIEDIKALWACPHQKSPSACSPAMAHRRWKCATPAWRTNAATLRSMAARFTPVCLRCWPPWPRRRRFSCEKLPGRLHSKFSGMVRPGALFQDFECEGRTGLSKAENIRLVGSATACARLSMLVTPRWTKQRMRRRLSLRVCGFMAFGSAVAPLASIQAPSGLRAALAAL